MRYAEALGDEHERSREIVAAARLLAARRPVERMWIVSGTVLTATTRRQQRSGSGEAAEDAGRAATGA